MRVFVQIVDSKTGISQHGMIEESIQKGFEIANALEHFGVKHLSVEWSHNFLNEEAFNTPRIMTGIVNGTSKIITIVAY